MNELRPQARPEWLAPLINEIDGIDEFTLLRHRLPPDPATARRAAVLVLFGDELPHGPDILLVERAATLREHAGQVAFPGGSVDPGDDGPVGTALREAVEETGLDASGVQPLALLPDLHIPPSGFVVTPVVAYWTRPSAVRAVDTAETAAVERIPIADLADPEHRIQVTGPSGYVGPAFTVAGQLVWGFTAGILSALLDVSGWVRPWDTSRAIELGTAYELARGRQEVGGA